MWATERVCLKLEGRGVKQDLIPYVGQLKLANVPVKGWIIDPVLHGLLYSPGDVVHLPANLGEIAHSDVMTKCVTMVTDGEGP